MMEDKIVVKSIKNWDKIIMSNLGGLTLAIITYVLICFSINDFVALIINFALILFIGGASSHFLISTNFRFFSEISIFENQIIIKSPIRFFDKNIPINDILTWTEKQNTYRKGNPKFLTLFTKNIQIEISSDFYKNYEELKNAITYGIQNDYNIIFRIKQNKYLVRIYTTLFLFICFSLFSIIVYLKKDTILINNTKIIILNEKVHEITQKNNKHKDDLYILKLINYPKIEFELSVYKLENKLKIGDSISIGIKKTDYDRNITKVIPITFWNFPLSNNKIDVYSLNTRSNSIIEIESYIKGYNETLISSIIIYIIASIVCLIIALANFYNYKTI